MKIHVVMHKSFEAPSAIEQWAENNGHAMSFTRIYQSEQFPINISSFDFLVIMGGSQSPATTLQEDPHFDAKKEIAFITKAINADKYLLGVCLGAQLIGEALGAKFEHSPNREIGKFPITLTKDGKIDHNLSSFPESLPVGHWHGDMPGLTREAKILATSEGCPRQIVRYSPKIYGFQCHLEFTKEAIIGMIENGGAHELSEFKQMPYIQKEEILIKNDYSEMNKYLFQFLDTFTGKKTE